VHLANEAPEHQKRLANFKTDDSSDSPDGNMESLAYDKSQDYRTGNETVTPDYNRRHHYAWMYEYRKVISNQISSQTTIKEETIGSGRQITKLGRFY